MTNMPHNKLARGGLFLLFLSCILPVEGLSFGDLSLSQGQTVYVSVYSNIFTAPKAIAFPLEATLIIRNTDPANSLTVTLADFYDTEGKLLKKYLGKEVVLKPLETTHIFIPRSKAEGGVGSNFIVRWKSAKEINAPIVECLMIGTISGQGISFISSGKVIQESAK